MTAKNYLNRGWYIENEITALIKAKEKAFTQATNCTSIISDTPSSITNVNSTEEKYLKYSIAVEKLDKQIVEHINQLNIIKTEVLTAINTVDNSVLRAILIYRYIDFMTFEQIAVEMNYSYKQITRLHGKALQKVKMS